MKQHTHCLFPRSLCPCWLRETVNPSHHRLNENHEDVEMIIQTELAVTAQEKRQRHAHRANSWADIDDTRARERDTLAMQERHVPPTQRVAASHEPLLSPLSAAFGTCDSEFGEQHRDPRRYLLGRQGVDAISKSPEAPFDLASLSHTPISTPHQTYTHDSHSHESSGRHRETWFRGSMSAGENKGQMGHGDDDMWDSAQKRGQREERQRERERLLMSLQHASDTSRRNERL